jgi:hypothetical protein
MRPTHLQEQKVRVRVRCERHPRASRYYLDAADAVDEEYEIDGNSQGLSNSRDCLAN